MDNATLFIEKYKKLEATVRAVYNLREEESIAYYLKNRNEFKKYADEISYCQRLRNFMQHEVKIGGKFSVVPSDEMVSFIDSLIDKIKDRPKCMDACVKFRDIYWCSYSSNVSLAIKAMRERRFTHVPILEGGKVAGVFDENSLFNYVADHGIVDVSDKLKFKDIKEYLSLEDRELESFIFVKSSLYVEEIEDIFQKNFNQKKRIGVAFVTVNGRADEALQGLITPWDILANNDY